MQQQSEEYGEIDRTCREEILSVQGSVYREVCELSLNSSNDEALLLPSVVVPDSVTSDDIISRLNVTGMERVTIASCIQLEREKTKKALQDAQFFRNVAERLKTEKRELASKMSDKVELVRDFWRNTVREGSSRAGKMVQRALDKQAP